MKKTISFKAGDQIYISGQTGPAYKVLSGTVRLSQTTRTHQSIFANIAISGDLLGAEVLLRKPYAFEAQALTDCEIAVWQEPSILWAEALAEELIKSSLRQSEVVSLRCGTAMGRILKFIDLLSSSDQSQSQANLTLPPLKETAEITDLTIETVSRCINSLRKQGILIPVQGTRGNLRNQFTFSSQSLMSLAA
ncbi:Crp/Fnr family transcriptional regulator [Polynucleobacter sp. 30F-ANTBAC]|jgi:CRP-like cAMP-binding protein|uniref:Crp/Fnr family transcriptional regulator n=1 Tax=Polynucleobacter sp. 30F-ANTBAC TaxID=2689095 RepID=UPI001C0B76F6|nr:Crp/Fnr family transcriptional regulator [Polynucleobacter sp. 30F-ANTBAC]MBU3599483.1 Crp/Fnr family transcriptional regulator [Polynucleobacter sp. 30F-ANTBAC]